MAETHSLKILDCFQVSPPLNTVPNSHLPLSFLDTLFFIFHPVKRIFFYQFPHPPHVFLQTTLPLLRHSLSLTLQHFFPLTSKIIFPPPPQEPHFLYSTGDSVTFTVAESAADFKRLISEQSQDVKLFHPLLPELPSPSASPEDCKTVFHPMAVQVTVFPSSGICLGVTFNHVAADGMAFSHFMKAWASVCKTKGNLSFIYELPPFHGREQIEGPTALKSEMLKQLWEWNSSLKYDQKGLPHDVFKDKVRATFTVRRAHIEKLKHQVSTGKESEQPLHISSFVVTCALVWVCSMKAEQSSDNNEEEHGGSRTKHFGIFADCRSRLGHPIPTTYFGNCLCFCVASARRNELLGRNGVIIAATAIGRAVGELGNGGATRRFRNELSLWNEIAGDAITVAGSPKLRAYETDFGWGRPRKSEVVSIDAFRSIALNECRDEEGGIQVGLALTRNAMEVFISAFEEALAQF